MGTDVTPSRKNILIEESDYKSPLSEAYGQKVAGSVNFINYYQNKCFDFKFLGPFGVLSVPEDGTRGNLFNYEVVGMTGYLFDRGDSGTTEVDIRYYRAGVDQGSILTTTLQILSGSGETYFGTETIDSNTETGPGVTLPVLSITDFNAFDHLAVKLTSAAVSVEQLTLNIHYRPR